MYVVYIVYGNYIIGGRHSLLKDEYNVRVNTHNPLNHQLLKKSIQTWMIFYVPAY
jgi:hypothetical protein